MEKSFQTRITVVLLAVFTAAAAVLASLNLLQENGYLSPTDGVVWVESNGGLLAQRVAPGSAGEHAGLKTGDLMVKANDQPVPRWASLAEQMIRTKVYNTITYTVMRDGVRIEVPVILDAQDRSFNDGFRLIALVYLGIGLYVLFRRWTAPHSTHFYIFCLVSFVLYSFKYTGKMDGLDHAVYWGNILAEGLQPALFLHFALAFADERGRRRPRLMSLVYLPGAFVVGLRIAAIWLWSATEVLRHRLDQIGIGYDALFYVLAAIVLFVSYKRTSAPLRRQQLKWLTRGTFVAVTPFALLYAIPYLANFHVPDLVTKIAGISLVFLPLTFSWAIVRYRLMDTDLIFKRGVTYTLATASLVGFYFLLVAIAAEVVRKRLPNAGAWGVIAAIVITAQLFDPLKKRIQDQVDRVFDRKRYDYRQTLIDFGQGLNSQTDLKALLNAIVDRLPRTLLVTRIAVFLAEGERGHFALAAGHGLPSSAFEPGLDLGLLDFDQPDSGSHIFLENPQAALHLSESERRAASLLDLNYYLPCRVQDRAIAVIGLGRTADGDFLSSEDVELLESLASYIGIAIQNARLYASLEEKISEYERLKEFNENIVESINVGILAVDLEDRIDSWNSQMEVMYALPRAEALHQPLADVFPAELMDAYRLATRRVRRSQPL